MQKTSQTRLNQLLISVIFLMTSSLCLQVHANNNLGFSDYRLQKVVSNPEQQNLPSQQQPVPTQALVADSKKPQLVESAASLSLNNNLPLIILALVVIGMSFLLFAPARFLHKKTKTAEDNSKPVGNVNTDEASDIVDSYMASIEAEDELEHQLDVEEELDSIDPKMMERIDARDRKHTNRYASRRKR